MLTHGSYFTGGGVAQAMLKDKWNILFGVECDPSNYNQSMRIADCYEQNIGAHMIRQPVQDINPADLPYVDWFHSSPVCKNFSNAKAGASESGVDIVTAQTTADYISYHKPRFVTIENVWAYRKSEAWAIIGNTLLGLGYGMRVDHVNMADYGVPQTRKRMIVQAVRNYPRLSPLPATHAKEPQADMFGHGLKKWVGWYEAIEDLIPTLKPDKFADWQIAKLPDEIKRSFVFGNGQWSDAVLKDDPHPTVTANGNQSYIKAYLAEGRAGGDRPLQLNPHNDPAMTVTTASGGNIYRALLVNTDSKMGTVTSEQPAFSVVSSDRMRDVMAWLEVGQVVRLSPCCWARFQSIPDSYTLPAKEGDAVTSIGNGVPSLFMDLVGDRFIKIAKV